MKTNFLVAKRKMQGATIVEVMVSVFLLTFGILALMLAQVRSVAGIGKAENRTLIAQAAEALAEGMQVNPTVSQVNKKLFMQYDRYTGDAKAVEPKNFVSLDDNPQYSKAQLAQVQIDNFEAALNQIPEVSHMSYIICADNDTPAEPTLSAAGVFEGNCAAANTVSGAVIKIAWRMKNTASNNANETNEFTYVLKVKG